MSGLLSIAPVVENVDVMGTQVTVLGVSARGIAHLLAQFPELRMLMSGKEVTAEKLFEIAPAAVAEIIAAGVGQAGRAETIAAADRLPLDAQLDVLGAILRLTLPKGIGPFVEKLGVVMGGLGAPVPAAASSAAPSTAPATN